MAFNSRQNGPALPSWAPLALMLVISLGCVAVYAREGAAGPLHAVQNVAGAVASPFALAGSAVGAGAQGVADAAGDAVADESSLSALREQNAELRELVAEAEEYRQEVGRLQGLLDIVDTYDIDGIAARVVGRSADAWNQTVTVSAGSNDGVDAGMTVMGPSGVVGQVISVSSTSATVRLLTDPQSGAAAIVQSSRAEGVVRGSLEGALYLEDVDPGVTVSEGDVVLTSGLGGSYVRGLMIGTVVSVEATSTASTRTIIVSPNESAAPLQEVVIVRSLGSSGADAGDTTGTDGVDDTQGGEG